MTRARHTRRRDGYTLIEVMMAVGILMVGSVGIFAMQQAATRANIEARQMTTANNIARTWAERLRRDQLYWRASGGGVNLAGTRYLQAVPVGAAMGGWTTPAPLAMPTESYAFDWQGQDVAPGPGGAGAFYCTNIRYQWFVANEAIRADIRVWWVRQQVGDARLMSACRPGGEAVASASIGPGLPMRAVHVSTLLHWVTPQ
jgi:type II secretory pathway pseudopilin PulG